MIATQPIYRTDDNEIVAATDPRVAYLVCGAGQEIPKDFVDAAAEWCAANPVPVEEEAVDDAEATPEPTSEAPAPVVDEAPVAEVAADGADDTAPEAPTAEAVAQPVNEASGSVKSAAKRSAAKRSAGKK